MIHTAARNLTLFSQKQYKSLGFQRIFPTDPYVLSLLSFPSARSRSATPYPNII